MESSLIEALLNRQVTVETCGLRIRGRLLAASEAQSRPYHKPCTLILETSGGICIARTWTAVFFDRRS